MHSFVEAEILITVRAYPEPSSKYVETSCVAGVDLLTKKPIRIFPVRARVLEDAHQFKKYSVIRAQVQKSTSDPRPESFKINEDSINLLREIPTGVGKRRDWAERNDLIEPFRIAGSIEELQSKFDEEGKSGAPSLALIRPKAICRLTIEHRGQAAWSEKDLSKLGQLGLFDDPRKPRDQLEFIPFRFKYDFTCDDPTCTGHSFSMLDWEVNQSYRKWRDKYGASGWEKAFRQKYEEELINERSLQFFVGTINSHPRTWSIIGIYYPPKAPKDEPPQTQALF